jgi:1,5-anhydro-D-fructose reductase (1,5-anhydro-D-mannitol-forming)
VLLAVGFQLRHKHNNVLARNMIAAGELGELVYADASIGAGQSLYPYDTWRADPALAGGGTLLHQGTHVIDLLGFLTSRRIVRVTAQTVGSPEDVFVGTCELEGDLLATLSSHHMHAGTRPDWVVAGRDGWMECRGGTFPTRGDTLLLHKDGKVTEVGGSTVSAYAAEVIAFNAAARKEAPVNGTGIDGLTNIAVVAALYEASRSGGTTAVEDVSSE